MVAGLLVVVLVALMAGAVSPAVHTVVVVEVHASSKLGTECNEKEQAKQIALHSVECKHGEVDPDLVLRGTPR